ncbi:MAG: SAM-dependent DNA methyltransferase [Leptospiraceae bacterium]|nr:SAM-dependent DNA methyltransferase [Leptospiraceae bacterium]MCP5494180.1 SAM-dependent DNA methyltransferase [Leptospiraceae bacterium]
MVTQDIVQKLWSLCDILRDDGITYHEYVTELTLLLFLKMAKETGHEEKRIPEKLRWDSLVKLNGMNLYNHYKQALLDLSQVKDKLISSIYQDATTNIKQPRNLEQLISQIDKLEWHDAKDDGLGNLYEGLLEKNANETKSGAGQYFTPKPLIDAIVAVVQPQPGELIIDPAAGTGGFLIAADSYIKTKTSNLFDLEIDKQEFQKKRAFLGMELVADTHRLSLMNCMLHDIEGGKEGPILRTNMPSFGKRTEFSLEYLKPFIKVYGSDFYGKSKRKNEGENGRFRVFSRKYILDDRKDNLDISWLKDESAEDGENLPEPTELTKEIGNIFQFSVGKLKELEKELRGGK